MNTSNHSPEVLLADRRAIAGRLALVVSVLIALLYWYQLNNPVVAKYVAFPLVVLFALAMSSLARILLTGVALIISDNGLIDFTSSLGNIAWTEIRGAEIKSYFGIDLINLKVADEDAILSRLPILRRVMWRYFIKRSGGAFNIKAGYVIGGAEPLLATIRDRSSSAKLPLA